MTDLYGTNVLAPVVPFTTTDTYGTHYDIYGIGGMRVVADYTERNAIGQEKCKEGMLVAVQSDDTLWRLKANFNNPLVDGDWEEGFNTLIINNIINIDDAIKFAASKDIYVNGTTGSDDTGDGTVALPFATVNKGLTELIKFVCPVTMNLYIAAGTYTETINVPRELSGSVALIGDLNTPANVILEAANTALNILTCSGPARFYVYGIQFQGATASAGIFADRGDVSIFYCKFVNNKTAISSYNNSKVNLYDSAYGDTTIDCNNIAFSIALANQFNSVLNVGQVPVITNCVTGVLNRTASLYMSAGATITATNSCFLLERDSYTYLSGPFTLDCTADGASNTIFNIAQSELDFSSATVGMSNSHFGFFGYTGVKIVEIGASSYTYGSITTNAYLDSDSVLDVPGTLDATPVYYNGATAYGLDHRYTPLAHKTTEDALNGLVKVDGAGTYSAVTDNSATWDTALQSETDPIYSANTYAVDMDQNVATDSSPTFVNPIATSLTSPANTALGLSAGSVTSGNGKDVTITASDGYASGTTHGGNITLSAGNGNPSNSNTFGGLINLKVGIGTPFGLGSPSNCVVIDSSGNDSMLKSDEGSNLILMPGTTVDGEDGKSVFIYGATAYNSDGNGGNIVLIPGAKNGSGTDGIVDIDGHFTAPSATILDTDNCTYLGGKPTASTGTFNFSIGNSTLTSNTIGTGNCVFGRFSMGNNTVGSNNVSIGSDSMYTNISGVQNVGIGYGSLYYQTSGQLNTAIGNRSGYSLTTGTSNTFIGSISGDNASQKVDATNSTAIGNGSYTTASNQIVLGDSNVTEVKTWGSIKVFSGSTEKAHITASSGDIQTDGDIVAVGDIQSATMNATTSLTTPSTITPSIVSTNATIKIKPGIATSGNGKTGYYLGGNSYQTGDTNGGDVIIGAGAQANSGTHGNIYFQRYDDINADYTQYGFFDGDTGNLEIVQHGMGIILQSPNGTRYKLSVDNAGALVIAAA